MVHLYLLAGCLWGSVAHAERPNVLLIVADDLGLGDVGIYDDTSTIPTPALDRLAAQGLRFSDAHSPASVCSPSRYGILTGNLPIRRAQTPVVKSAYHRPVLRPEDVTLPELLRTAGYRTAIFGKWHLGMVWPGLKPKTHAKPGVGTSHFTTTDVDFGAPILDGPLQHGFDTFYGLASSLNHGPYTFVADDRVEQLPVRIRDEREVDGHPQRQGWIAPDWDDTQADVHIAERARAFVGDHVASHPDTPLFMYYPTATNHFPHLPPAHFDGQPIAGTGGDDDGLPARNDMVVLFDRIVAALLATLDDPNGDGDTSDSIAANTLVIVTSDNGADAGRHPLLRSQKGTVYEGGHRVPLLVRWPSRIRAGEVDAHVVSLVDVYATLAVLTGVDVQPGQGVDSHDLGPVLWGEAEPGWSRGPMLHRENGGSRCRHAVRDGDHKLHFDFQGAPGALYDLGADLREQTDISAANPELVQRLIALRDTLQAPPGPPGPVDATGDAEPAAEGR